MAIADIFHDAEERLNGNDLGNRAARVSKRLRGAAIESLDPQVLVILQILPQKFSVHR